MRLLLSHVCVVGEVVSSDAGPRPGRLAPKAHGHIFADAWRGFVDDGAHARLSRGYVLGTGRQARVNDVAHGHAIILPGKRLLLNRRNLIGELLRILAAQERPVRLGEVVDRRLRCWLKTPTS